MFDISLDDIEKLNDDVTDVQVTDDYVDQSNPPPPLAGNYRLRVLDGDLKKDRETGELIEQDGKYPIFELRTVEIVEPAALTRKVALFQDIRSKPFDRQGYPASLFGDLIRSLDETARFVGMKAGVKLLRELLGKDTSFKVQLDWEATDLELVKSRRESGVTDNDELYKDARVRGMKNFPKLGNGKPNHVWTNPVSGNKVEARATIKRFYPSSDTKVKLGAFGAS